MLLPNMWRFLGRGKKSSLAGTLNASGTLASLIRQDMSGKQRKERFIKRFFFGAECQVSFCLLKLTF